MQISDNEIYLSIKYIKSVLWRVAKCLSYIEEARCLKVKANQHLHSQNTELQQNAGTNTVYKLFNNVKNGKVELSLCIS